jgi:hypothetical protein
LIEKGKDGYLTVIKIEEDENVSDKEIIVLDGESEFVGE